MVFYIANSFLNYSLIDRGSKRSIYPLTVHAKVMLRVAK